MNFEDELKESTAESNDQLTAELTTSELVKSFKLAVTLLIGASIVVKIVLHFMAPGT